MPDLDPNKPIVGEDGLEYETLGHLICGVPVECYRNRRAERQSQHVGPKDSADWHLWRTSIWELYTGRSRDGSHFAATGRTVLPQGLEFFDPRDLPGYVGSPEGAGGSRPLQAALNPVHAAD